MLKAERLMAITLLLQARGKMTAERLADILGVSVRTIYRDMDTLSLAHVPVSMDYGPGGGYFLAGDYRADASGFTGDEALALALGGVLIGSSRLVGSGDGLRRALLKLEAALPEEYRGDVRAARERLLFDDAPWYRPPVTPEHLETVRRAVWDEHRLDLFYPRSDGAGLQWRQVEPYGLVFKAGVWYLVAYCRLRQDFRTFRIDRIEDLARREEPITPRPNFDLQSYWSEARQRLEERVMPYSFTLRVSPALVPRLTGDRLLVGRERDGTALVRIAIESAPDALHYVLWLGPGVTVIDPPDLAQEVAEAARRIAASYAEVST